MDNFEKYLTEDDSMVKIKECVAEIMRTHRNKRKVIPYDDILSICDGFKLYKDALPEVQAQLEDDNGYTIGYDKP